MKKITIKKIHKNLDKLTDLYRTEISRKIISTNYKPKKKSTAALKALDAFMYVIACASISLMLVILLIQWMSI